MNRKQIAKELLKGCPAESFDDHKAIAAAIIAGDSKDQLLVMPEVNRWPETYVWLQDNL